MIQLVNRFASHSIIITAIQHQRFYPAFFHFLALSLRSVAPLLSISKFEFRGTRKGSHNPLRRWPTHVLGLLQIASELFKV